MDNNDTKNIKLELIGLFNKEKFIFKKIHLI